MCRHRRVDAQRGGRLNLLLGDGTRLFATRGADSLHVRTGGGATTVASEAGDDDPTWTRVPERTLVVATAGTAELVPLPS